MTLTWEAGLFLLALFSALAAVQSFVTRSVVRDEMAKGNGYRKIRDCEKYRDGNEACHVSVGKRLAELEHEVLHPEGYVRARFHELAGKLHVKLAKRELAKVEEN